MFNHEINPSHLTEECVICFYPLGNEAIAQVDCGHIYHHKCIKKWLKVGKTKKCPMCNTGENIIYRKKNWSLFSLIFCCFFTRKEEPVIVFTQQTLI